MICNKMRISNKFAKKLRAFYIAVAFTTWCKKMQILAQRQFVICKKRTITKQDRPLQLTLQQSAKIRDHRQKTRQRTRSLIGNTNRSLSMFVLFAICDNNKIRYFFSRCGIYIPHADATWEMPENSGFYRL